MRFACRKLLQLSVTAIAIALGKDGRSFTKEGTGREFIWDFEELVRRIRPLDDGTVVDNTQFAELIDLCRQLDRLDGAAHKLISLTMRR